MEQWRDGAGWSNLDHLRAGSLLGLVLYRRGSLDEARRELLEAIRLYPQPSASALFALAVTCRRLGRAEKTHSAYERAVSRMRATYPQDPRLIRAQLETSGLIGG